MEKVILEFRGHPR